MVSTVKELIDYLSQYQEDLPVVILDKEENIASGTPSKTEGFHEISGIRGELKEGTGLCVSIQFTKEKKKVD